MRWGTYASPADASVHPGVLDDGMMYGLAGTDRLIELLDDDGARLAEAARRALDDPLEEIPEFETDLFAPIPEPPGIVWRGPDAATLVTPVRVHGPFDAIPAAPGVIGFRLAVAAVLGAPNTGHIAGYTVLAVWGTGGGERVSMGPHLVTGDELAGAGELRATVTVNDRATATDEPVDVTAVAARLADAALGGTAPVPGTVFGLGEVCGGSAGPGDEVVLTIPHLGVLDHRIVAPR